MLKEFSNQEIQDLWKKQLSVLKFRHPNWILFSLWAPLIIVVLGLLMATSIKGKVHSLIVIVIITYTVYALLNLWIYIYLVRLQKRKARKKSKPYFSAWLYGINSISSLTLYSLLLLIISFIRFDVISLPPKLLDITKIVVLTLFLLIGLIIFFLTPYLLRKRLPSIKQGISLEAKWVTILSATLIGLGILVSQVFLRTGQINLLNMLMVGLFLICSNVLMAICSSGIYVLIVLAKHGFENMADL